MSERGRPLELYRNAEEVWAAKNTSRSSFFLLVNPCHHPAILVHRHRYHRQTTGIPADVFIIYSPPSSLL